jgi:hypothetical protein
MPRIIDDMPPYQPLPPTTPEPEESKPEPESED